MQYTHPASAANRLLAALPIKERQRFLVGCEQVDLTFADVLAEPGEPIRHVYFPTESFILLTAETDRYIGLEVGLIGDDGMLGISLMLGVKVSPLHAQVQGAGQALRMDAASFSRELGLSPALQRLLNRYLYMTIAQLAQTAVCNRFHVLEARLARLLLMMQDRVHSDHLHVTHKLLARMLGVRREGITTAATSLHNRDLIAYSRGNITIMDRGGLEFVSCECYKADKAIYARMIGYWHVRQNGISSDMSDENP